MKKNTFVIGVDIGGTNTEIGVVDHFGKCIHQSHFPTGGHHTVEEYIITLVSSITALSGKMSAEFQLEGIGIGAPAARRHEGTVQNSANLAWGTFDIVNMMKKYFDIPVAVINDSNASALGELNYGLAQGKKNFISVTIGTGLGAGIVIDGNLISGENDFAGELGHTIIDRNGRMCGCGRRGCVETYVSAPGMRRTVFELLASLTNDSILRTISYNDLTSETIHALAANGDIIAKKAFEKTGDYLGKMLADAATTFDPDMIILSGGLLNAGDLLLLPAIESFNEHTMQIHKNKVTIARSQFKNGVGAILGASCLISNMALSGRKVTAPVHNKKSEPVAVTG